MSTFQKISDRLRQASIRGMFLTDEERCQLELEINEVLEAIAKAPTFDDADKGLQELGRMQNTLATICFKYRVELSAKQRQLVREYDRWDDPNVRLSTYEAIKKGGFLSSTAEPA